jgi:hypothetical protein
MARLSVWTYAATKRHAAITCQILPSVRQPVRALAPPSASAQRCAQLGDSRVIVCRVWATAKTMLFFAPLLGVTSKITAVLEHNFDYFFQL